MRDAILNSKYEEITKEEICNLWNESCIFFYRLYQNRWEYNENADIDHLRKYLELSVDDIHINEDVVNYLKDDFLNGEYFFIEMSSGQVNVR